jgi:putative tryptophan/tyrosine transport system substrate-binding protein
MRNHIGRREFITLLGGAAATWPLASRAQQDGRVPRVGVLMINDAAEDRVRVALLRDALAKLGWTEGRNLRVDYRFAATDPEAIRTYAAELVSLAPDVIFGVSTPVLEALRNQTRSVPIVFAGVSDPVSAGFVPSLARPGGNITGFSNFEYAISAKWLELLKEAAPNTTRAGIILFRDDPSWSRYLAPIEAAAPSFGVQVMRIFLGDPDESARAIDAFAQEPQGGLVVTNNPRARAQRDLIVELAARHRLPAVYPARFYATSGGLMSYGIDPDDPMPRAAAYLDRILRGEKPGDLPVQLPTKYEFVVNLKTMRVLGLTLPLPLIGRTDEVIE